MRFIALVLLIGVPCYAQEQQSQSSREDALLEIINRIQERDGSDGEETETSDKVKCTKVIGWHGTYTICSRGR